LQILKQASGTPTATLPPGWPTATNTPTPTSTPILPPEEEAAALDRRVRDLEDMLNRIETILRQFGLSP